MNMSRSVSIFANLQRAPAQEIPQTTLNFLNDPHPNKVNVGVGAYRTDEGKPYIFEAVKEAERRILADTSIYKEYLPILGHAQFNKYAQDLLLGNPCSAVEQGRVVTAQTISASGALRLAAQSLRFFLKPPLALFSNPTWDNQSQIFEHDGWAIQDYAYWNPQIKWLDFDQMLADLRAAPNGSVVVLHACAHNPTGVDPSLAQWEEIANIVEQNQLFPLFDVAYQGFATGDLENDAAAVRLFIERGFEMAITQSFSKNMGLYAERVGALHFVLNDSQTANILQSQLQMMIRGMYTSPPQHGALIAATVLGDPHLKEMWINELKGVSQRIIDMRQSLYEQLVKLGVEGDWTHIIRQNGMFAFTGLTSRQCEYMIEKWHVYLIRSGRISMAGVNTGNVEYVARAIQDAVREIRQ